MEVLLNGQPRTIADSITVHELVTELELQGKFAIEVNQAIIPRSEYSQATVQPGDRIEVVQAIGGG